MPEPYSQQNSPLRFKAQDLGDDDLLITRLTGTEALSELFQFELELLAPIDKPVDFAQVLGKGGSVAIDVPGSDPRFFQGIIVRFAQGPRDDRFLTYRATLVPEVWLLTKRITSRIFQHVSVPEILKAVFDGFPVAFRLQGKFQPRDYCVQYRESDFAFASRLMEEEGIFYYFRHTKDGGEMEIANTPQGHDKVPAPATLIYEETAGGNREGDEESRVTGWQKMQEVRSGQVTLWDHHFELPDKHLEADQKIQDSVAVGQVSHTLSLPVANGLEQYDYPGGYAGRFDGISPGGAEQAAELEKIFEDNRRTARLRIQEEAAGAVSVDGTSVCRQMTAGHMFTLDRHFDADGDYVLTRITHKAGLGGGGYRSGDDTPGLEYENAFRCIPFALPFRPPRVTPKPTVKGTQTAVVVGPEGDEIFTDKYSRIKVQFPWDRLGKYDADSSCWIRVATIWAGKNWGVIHIPRIGQEVVVDFLEGDPDQPIVIGSVYNADEMPPYLLPDNMTQSGTKSRSSAGGNPETFNEIRFEDKKGQELVTIHAEKDMSTSVEHDDSLSVGNNHSMTVGTDPKGDPKKNGTNTTTTFGDTKFTVTKGDYSFTVAAGKADYYVKGPVTEVYDNTQSTTVTNGIDIVSKTDHVHVTAPVEIVLTVGSSSITIKPDTILLKSPNILFDGGTKITGVAPLVDFEGKTNAKFHAPHVTIDGVTDATLQSSGGWVDVAGTSKATLECGSSVLCDPGKVAIAGTAIKSSAQGTHEITGSLVKIN
jgi:type VI secretion system secreted protein VgrG